MKQRRKNSRLKPHEIEKVKELSKTHFVNDIAKIIGCSKGTILNYQLDPAYGIENPKRKHVKRKTENFATNDGYFDIKAWGRMMAF